MLLSQSHVKNLTVLRLVRPAAAVGALAMLMALFQAGGASAQTADLPSCGAYPLTSASYACQCPAGSATGSVWGSGPYTADSSICAAAQHGGYLPREGGRVVALRFDGLAAYLGTHRNGIATQDWGAYGDSFIFDANQR